MSKIGAMSNVGPVSPKRDRMRLQGRIAIVDSGCLWCHTTSVHDKSQVKLCDFIHEVL